VGYYVFQQLVDDVYLIKQFLNYYGENCKTKKPAKFA